MEIKEDTSANLERVVLVDASELRDLDKFIKPETVIEIIDHRKVNDAAFFKNAKIQIELVGSAATLIAEKFYMNKIEISRDAATLLYGAIISNTLNFRSKNTTDRDRRMAEWLNKKFKFPQTFADDMFRAKSDVAAEKLAQRIEADFAWFAFGIRKIGFAQLEIMDAKIVAETRKTEIFNILNTLKTKENLDDIFISLIDLGAGYNIFIAENPSMQSILANILGVMFQDDIATRPGFMMRKEITPLLREKLG